VECSRSSDAYYASSDHIVKCRVVMYRAGVKSWIDSWRVSLCYRRHLIRQLDQANMLATDLRTEASETGCYQFSVKYLRVILPGIRNLDQSMSSTIMARLVINFASGKSFAHPVSEGESMLREQTRL
jgi:hypothetical protein